ncbi:MAG: hypothetical protein ACLVEU_08570 [Bacteroides cellulosilyticus]
MGQDTIDLKSLADSVRKANGKPNFLPLGMHFLELASEPAGCGEYQSDVAQSAVFLPIIVIMTEEIRDSLRAW